MLTVSVTTLRTGALDEPAPDTAGAAAGSRAGAAADGVSRDEGTGAGATCMGTGAGTAAGGGVLGLLSEGAGLASGAGTTLLMTLSTREKRRSHDRIVSNWTLTT